MDKYRLFAGQRPYGKRDAMVGEIALQLLQGKTVLSVCRNNNGDGIPEAVAERLRKIGDSEPETALCGLTVKALDEEKGR